MSLHLWQASAQGLARCNLVTHTRLQSSFAAGTRALSRPRPAFTERLHASQSRGVYLNQHETLNQHSTSGSVSSLLKSTRNARYSLQSPKLSGPILQSAFPKKTFIFVLALGAVLYFFTDVVIVDESCWHQKLSAAFAENHAAMPFHSYANRAVLDHWIQAHIPDPSAQARDPEVLKTCIEKFHLYAGGWEMTEEESLDENIPITHGCRYKSNVPSVSSCP